MLPALRGEGLKQSNMLHRLATVIECDSSVKFIRHQGGVHSLSTCWLRCVGNESSESLIRYKRIENSKGESVVVINRGIQTIKFGGNKFCVDVKPADNTRHNVLTSPHSWEYLPVENVYVATIPVEQHYQPECLDAKHKEHAPF